MQRNTIFTIGFIFYFLIISLAAKAIGISLVTTIIVMLAFPIFVLARYSAAPSIMLFTITGFGTGVAILLEGIAHLYGLWSSSLVSEFGAVSFGLATITFMKILFLVLFYELLFDDGVYQISQARSRFVEFLFFGIAGLILVFILAKFFITYKSPEVYYWMTVVLLAASFAMLMVWQRLTQRLFNKLFVFVCAAAIPMLAVELSLVAGGYKEIITMLHPVAIPLYGISLPLGEILLAFSLPAFISSVYELYLDDGK